MTVILSESTEVNMLFTNSKRLRRFEREMKQIPNFDKKGTTKKKKAYKKDKGKTRR